MTRVHSHYDNLKVSRDAPPAVIKAAYRTLSQQYHPDRCERPDAQRIMAILNASYAVLSDPTRRASHDRWLAQQEQAAPAWPPQPAEPDPGPPTRAAGPARAQPAFGWWAATKHVLGRLPRAVHLFAVLLLGVHALNWYNDRPRPADTTPLTTAEQAAVLSAAAEMIGATPAAPAPHPALRNWNTPASEEPTAAPFGASHGSPSLDSAPNGRAWPREAGYLDGVPVRRRNGHSTVSVDNSSNAFAVHIKLMPLAGDAVARELYLPSGASFTMASITPGRYEIRYRNLRTGSAFKSQPFDLSEDRVEQGVRFSRLSLTLYTVHGGNTRMESISATEF